ncbi:hypothetical protein DTO027B9_2828 [Paecilomyces variotii]|nr:hypothetical protein DTO027B9_2828 [Paecilomyces variotii]KAJ9387697.1 hypothetical protein DTO063F5_2923 [Paecilomyces variotii]
MPHALPQLQRVDRSEPTKIIQAIIDDGCCIIKNFTDKETVDAVNADTRPYLDADKPWKGDLYPPETRRCTNLGGRSVNAREKWIIDPLIRQLTATFVDKTTQNYYGLTKHTYTSEAVVSVALTMEIGPGAKAQRLHRDDKNYHMDHEDQTGTGYRVGSDVELAFLIPGVKTTFENGATQAIPGSHLWGSIRAPKVEEVCYAEMDVGDAFVMLGGTYHAGGANITQNEKRTVHGLFYVRGYMRQEENIYLVNKPEDVLTWSPEAQKVLGYSVSSPNIGFADFRRPIDYLRGDTTDDFIGDLDPSQEPIKSEA